MKITLVKLTAGCALVWAMAIGAQAQILADDPFLTGGSNYTTGTVFGQNPTVTGFAGPWFPADGSSSNDMDGQAHYDVSSTALGYVGTLGYTETPGSGSLVNTAGGGRADRSLAPSVTSALGATSGTVYMSFELQLTNPSGYQAVELWSPSGDQLEGNRVLQLGYSSFGDFPDSSNFGITVNNANSGTTTGSFDPVDLSTHLFVLQFNLNSGTNADTLSAWEDPTDITGGVPTGGTEVSLSGFSLPSNIGLLDVGTFAGSGPEISDVRFGTSLSDISGNEVVPEPSTNCLILLGLGTLFLLRRSRRVIG